MVVNAANLWDFLKQPTRSFFDLVGFDYTYKVLEILQENKRNQSSM